MGARGRSEAFPPAAKHSTSIHASIRIRAKGRGEGRGG